MVRKALEYLGFVSSDANFTPARADDRRRESIGQPSPRLVAAPSQPRPMSRFRGSEPAYAVIHTIRPRRYANDAENLAFTFRDGSPIIVDLSQMQEAEVRRIIDFMSGLVKGLDGTIRRVANKVFMLTPAGIAQLDEELDHNGFDDGYEDIAS